MDLAALVRIYIMPLLAAATRVCSIRIRSALLGFEKVDTACTDVLYIHGIAYSSPYLSQIRPRGGH